MVVNNYHNDTARLLNLSEQANQCLRCYLTYLGTLRENGIPEAFWLHLLESHKASAGVWSGQYCIYDGIPVTCKSRRKDHIPSTAQQGTETAFSCSLLSIVLFCIPLWLISRWSCWLVFWDILGESGILARRKGARKAESLWTIFKINKIDGYTYLWFANRWWVTWTIDI